MIYSGKNVPAGQEATLRLRPGMQVKPGDLVCRLTDAKQMAEAASLPEPTIDVRMAPDRVAQSTADAYRDGWDGHRHRDRGNSTARPF